MEIYGKIVSNVFFGMIPIYDVNLMCSKVVELKKAYLIGEIIFKSIKEVIRKIKNFKTFTIKVFCNVWKMYGTNF